jgi:hypothetical protein
VEFVASDRNGSKAPSQIFIERPLKSYSLVNLSAKNPLPFGHLEVKRRDGYALHDEEAKEDSAPFDHFPRKGQCDRPGIRRRILLFFV